MEVSYIVIYNIDFKVSPNVFKRFMCIDFFFFLNEYLDFRKLNVF